MNKGFKVSWRRPKHALVICLIDHMIHREIEIANGATDSVIDICVAGGDDGGGGWTEVRLSLPAMPWLSTVL